MMLSFFDVLGLMGVAIILITYFLLQLEKLLVQQSIYSILNMLGALLIFISLTKA